MTNEIVFETERLVARNWSVEMAEQAMEVYGDPEVTKYMDGVTFESIEAMRERIQWVINRNRRFDPGLGSFPVFLKSSDQYLGTALIKNLPDGEANLTPDIEIGWHLGSRFWGHGFATEFGAKLIEIGFSKRRLDNLHAVVDRENEGSKRVALRLGMTYVGLTSKYYGQQVDHFILNRDIWESGRTSDNAANSGSK